MNPHVSQSWTTFPRLASWTRLKLGAGLGAVCLAGAVAASPALASPATWHVRTDGSDASCSGLVNAADPGMGTIPRSCAFKSPQHAFDAAAGGDTVLIHAGTYTAAGTTVQGNKTILGINLRTDLDSESVRLAVRAAGDGPVVFDGGGVLDSGVTIWGTCFVTIEGIEMLGFTGDRNGLFAWGAAGVDVGSPGSGDPSRHLILKTLNIHDSTLDHVTGSNAEIAIWCADCTNNRIDSCTIVSVEPVAIAIGSDAAIALEQDGTLSATSITHDRSGQSWTGILSEHATHWRVDGNYIAERSGTPSASTDLVRLVNSDVFDITNNVFYRPPHAAINLVDDLTDGTDAEQHYVLNNTIDCASSGGFGIRAEGCSACQVRNDIVTSCQSAVFFVSDNTATQLGFNDLFDNQAGYDNSGFGFGYQLLGADVLDDPLFKATVPRPDPFYRLQDASPAINAGDNTFCAAVTADNKCDIGAFQAVTSGGNRPPAAPKIALVDKLTGRSARLNGSAFSDPDPGDTHHESQWQVDLETGDFSAPVKDSGATTSDLTSFVAQGLAATTDYKARVRYRDQHDAWSPWSDPASNAAAHFTTLVATAIPPKVVVVAPANGARGVLVGFHPTLTFNVPVEAASVTGINVRLLRGGAPVTQMGGSPALDGSEMTVTLTPAALLDPDSKYKLAVVGGASGIQSRDGSIPGKSFSSSFTTETALASSIPPNGATGVSTAVAPQLVFKWAVDPASLTATSVRLRDLATGKSVALASITASADGLTVTLTPAAPLKANHKFAVQVSAGASGVRFLDGRRIGKTITVAFRTA